MKKKVKVVLLFLGIVSLVGSFYWFYFRPREARQQELENKVQQLQKQVKNNYYDGSDNSEEIRRLKSDLEDTQLEMEQARQDAEDEENNRANCENFGGVYQGNGMCIYY